METEGTQSALISKYAGLIQIGLIMILVYLLSFYGYLLFHSLAEGISIVVAFGIFAVTWNSRRYMANHYFLFIGIAFFFIALVDTIHALSYKGMNVIAGSADANLSTQLWVAGRYLVGVTLVIAPLFITRKLNEYKAFYLYLAVTAALFFSIFWLTVFPTTYIEGQGLTWFKRASEAVISLLLAYSLFLLYKRRDRFDGRIFSLLAWSIVLTIISEILFALYAGAYDSVNMAGHLLKIAAFYLIYLAIIEIGLSKPFSYLFKELKESDHAHQLSEEKFRAIFDNAAVGIILADLNSRPVMVNGKFEKIIGYSKDELYKMEISDFTHPDDMMLDKEKFKKMKLGLISNYYLEKRYLRKDGRIIWADLSVSVIRDPGGEPQYTMGVIRDITKRQVAEEEIKNLAKFPEQNPSPVLRIDHNGIIIYANPECHDLLEAWGAMVYGNAPVRWIGIISRALSDNLKEEVVETYGGKIVSFLIVPVKEYGYVNLYGRDITKAELIDRAKTEFVSLASHQLRTPLASISLASELLLRGVGGELEGRQKKYLEEIYCSTQRMTDLINALLNISRIELGTFVLKAEPLDLAKSLESVLSELALQINGKKLDLKTNFEKVPIIEFDQNVFRIIAENLITNAIRYSESGGPIIIRLEKNQSHILLTVSDKGCGIPEIARDKIFNKLFRAENAKEMNRDGTGLGLYIVKSVAEKAGAKIKFESHEGEGTTFYVSIPIKKDLILS